MSSCCLRGNVALLSCLSRLFGCSLFFSIFFPSLSLKTLFFCLFTYICLLFLYSFKCSSNDDVVSLRLVILHGGGGTSPILFRLVSELQYNGGWEGLQQLRFADRVNALNETLCVVSYRVTVIGSRER